MMAGIRYSQKSHPKAFTVPLYSTTLAEFCGILLGDGGISTYQTSITLNSETDFGYSRYVLNLVEELFGILPGIHIRKNAKALTIVISRIGIVEFLTNYCGLSKGNKCAQQVSVPDWILSDEQCRIACVRGLFDTDGSVFNHKYTSKGKQYAYKKLGFTNRSLPLLSFFHTELRAHGMHARFGSRSDVRIDRQQDVREYFILFSSHNPKHLRRYQF